MKVLAAPLGCVVLFIYLCSCLLARWKRSAGCCLHSKVRSLRPCLDVNDAQGEFRLEALGAVSPPLSVNLCVYRDGGLVTFVLSTAYWWMRLLECRCKAWLWISLPSNKCAKTHTHTETRAHAILHESVHPDLASFVQLEVSCTASILVSIFHYSLLCVGVGGFSIPEWCRSFSMVSKTIFIQYLTTFQFLN